MSDLVSPCGVPPSEFFQAIPSPPYGVMASLASGKTALRLAAINLS
jgi:hypothetical protein